MNSQPISAVSNILPNQAQSSTEGSEALVLAFLKTAGEVRVIETHTDLYIIEARALSPTAPQVHIETDTVAVSDVHVHLIGLADTFSHLTVGLA
jgi:hypothetical protein